VVRGENSPRFAEECTTFPYFIIYKTGFSLMGRHMSTIRQIMSQEMKEEIQV
jgi:hypothetical protein